MFVVAASTVLFPIACILIESLGCTVVPAPVTMSRIALSVTAPLVLISDKSKELTSSLVKPDISSLVRPPVNTTVLLPPPLKWYPLKIVIVSFPLLPVNSSPPIPPVCRHLLNHPRK